TVPPSAFAASRLRQDSPPPPLRGFGETSCEKRGKDTSGAQLWRPVLPAERPGASDPFPGEVLRRRSVDFRQLPVAHQPLVGGISGGRVRLSLVEVREGRLIRQVQQ